MSVITSKLKNDGSRSPGSRFYSHAILSNPKGEFQVAYDQDCVGSEREAAEWLEEYSAEIVSQDEQCVPSSGHIAVTDDLLKIQLSSEEGEAADLRARDAALEVKKVETLLSSQLTTKAATKPTQEHEEETEEYVRKLLSKSEFAKREADEKETIRCILDTELEAALDTLSKAGEGAAAAVALREEFEKRTLLVMERLEKQLDSEAIARTASEERVRAIDSKQERGVLHDLLSCDDGSVMTPSIEKIELERGSHSPSALLALATSPAALASLRAFHRDLGMLLDDKTNDVEDQAPSLSDMYANTEADNNFNWSSTRATVDDRRDTFSARTAVAGSRKAADVLLAFEHIYPPPDSRSPVKTLPTSKSMCALDGEDFESSAPNPLYKRAASSSPARPSSATGRNTARRLTEEEDELATVKSMGESIKGKLEEGKRGLEKERVVIAEDDVVLSEVSIPGYESGLKDIETDTDTVTEIENDDEEIRSTSVMHDMEFFDDNSSMHLDSQDEGSISAVTRNRIPNPRKKRCRSFIAGEHQLNLKLNRSLTAIYCSLEQLRVRTRHAQLSPPEPHSCSLVYNTDMGKVREAWRRLNEHHMSRDDMLALGPLPKIVHPVVKANEGALWAIFRCYCPPDCKMPLCVFEVDMSSSSLRGDSRRRVLSLTTIWDLLRDFDVCPDLCTYVPRASKIGKFT